MKLFFLLLIFLGFCTKGSHAQDIRSDSILAEIAFYSDVMVNADLDVHRSIANEKFLQAIDAFIAQPGSFGLSLDSIPWISVLKHAQFKVVTWQLRISNEEYKYGGFIQWPDRVVKLLDSRPWVNGSLRNSYEPGAWYGALYYQMIPFVTGSKEYYILFGFNAENSLFNTKVADILDLTGDEPKFGLPVFIGKDDPQTRLILTYSDASSVRFIFDATLNALIHDHLESLPVGPAGESIIVSDGSQEAWILREGSWHYQEKIYDVKSEEPPMDDVRKDRIEDKDILGRPKK